MKARVFQAVSKHKVPKKYIFNFDETGIRESVASSKTFARKGRLPSPAPRRFVFELIYML